MSILPCVFRNSATQYLMTWAWVWLCASDGTWLYHKQTFLGEFSNSLNFGSLLYKIRMIYTLYIKYCIKSVREQVSDQ